MIVIPADRMRGVDASPVDHRGRVWAVVHQIAQHQAEVMRLLEDRTERGPVSMNIRHK
jgi:hypothetical protein